MQLHPDKEIILEMFKCTSCQRQQQTTMPTMMDSGITEVQPLIERPLQFSNATGKTDVAKNTNAIILVSALVVALAIISIK